ncbi:hypothetical protein HanRHA438_Chr16g0781941 [Helianthus annuus]|nr:hypothetical protein HanRHA438_Chr16g0781941 [Helianthus annuus]
MYNNIPSLKLLSPRTEKPSSTRSQKTTACSKCNTFLTSRDSTPTISETKIT